MVFKINLKLYPALPAAITEYNFWVYLPIAFHILKYCARYRGCHHGGKRSRDHCLKT